jgi:protein-disulfide isomerase
MEDNALWIRRLVDGISIAIVVIAMTLTLIGLVVSTVTREEPSTLPDPQSIAGFWRLAESGQWMGPKRASVVVLVYSDYSCGFCKELHPTLEKLQLRYPEHVAVVVKHFVSPASLPSNFVTLGAECAADQGKFAEYHDAVFSRSEVMQLPNGWVQFAKAGMVPDLTSFEECVLSRRHAGKIAEQYVEAAAVGVDSTPTVFVAGRMIEGAIPFEELNALVAQQFPRRNRGGTSSQ